MPKDSKIIKNQIYKDYMEDDLFNENEGLRAQGEIAVTYTKGLNFINKDIRHLDFMKEPEAEKEIQMSDVLIDKIQTWSKKRPRKKRRR